MTKEGVCAVLHKADIQSPNWEKIAKLLNFDCIVLAVVFFNQWSALANHCQPSWKALAKALEDNQDHKYKQASRKALQAEGVYSVMVCIARILIAEQCHGYLAPQLKGKVQKAFEANVAAQCKLVIAI